MKRRQFVQLLSIVPLIGLHAKAQGAGADARQRI